ncbi:MAG: serine/threonine-protein kinase [Terriglobales bacterium]|jgi:serine/threonine protein kinase
MDDRRSERFGRYEILTELGRGAMGVVYKARDPKINRVVAVKTISLAGQPPEEEREYRERFFREAEAAGRLSHPGIVTIFDVGEEPETRAPYIVMEFVGGQTLDKLLSGDDHKLPMDTALQLTLELAEALDCAHGQGVVHRDLKPANILLTEDGHAKIADFGVAKLNLANQTLAGRALGTPAYMSPEQLNGDAVDGRSDLFSLGVVLYTMLTGHRPFQGNSAVTVSFKIVNHDPIAATLLNAELPPGLDYIIARAMAKDPAERYQRGMEMVFDIQELREGREPWSKAKLPVSSKVSQTSRGAAQTANERSKSSLGQLATAAKFRPSPRIPPLGHGAAQILLSKIRKKIRKKSYAGLLILAGLFVSGLWIISFDSRGARSRATVPLPAVAPVKTEATPTGQTPIVEKASQPLTAAGAHPATIKGARASLPTASAASSATLEIEVDHQFAEANLSIWVDDRLTYTHRLEGMDKKHLVVFHHVQGHEFHAMQVPPGKHRLRVRVTSDADAGAAAGTPGGFPAGFPTYDQSATVTGNFASGQENVLHINFQKHGEMNLSLQ